MKLAQIVYLTKFSNNSCYKNGCYNNSISIFCRSTLFYRSGHCSSVLEAQGRSVHLGPCRILSRGKLFDNLRGALSPSLRDPVRLIGVLLVVWRTGLDAPEVIGPDLGPVERDFTSWGFEVRDAGLTAIALEPLASGLLAGTPPDDGRRVSTLAALTLVVLGLEAAAAA